MEQDGSLEAESKQQAARYKREMRKIRTNLEGVRRMSRIPGAVVVVDAKKEYLSLREAGKLNVPTVGVLDTDSDPDTVDVAIPANDDSIRAVEIILNELADAVAIGKTMGSVRQPEGGGPVRPRRVRSRRPALARADGSAAVTGVATATESAVDSETPDTEGQEGPEDAETGVPSPLDTAQPQDQPEAPPQEQTQESEPQDRQEPPAGA
jgi:small subunit ribosomal protein S2